MHLSWRKKDFNEDLDFILFTQRDGNTEFWRKKLFDAYPDLNYEYAKSLAQDSRFEYITQQMKVQARKRESDIENAIKIFQASWDQTIAPQLNDAYSSAFDNDCANILNDMVGEVGLNPICPRNIRNRSFALYHFFDSQYSMTLALHEITHFVWFYFWKKHFNDDITEYDFPNIKWLLSEIIVETIIRNSEINDLIKMPKYIAYYYFYDMNINGALIFDTQKELYLTRKNIYDFMEKSFDWIKNNELELRRKIADAEK